MAYIRTVSPREARGDLRQVYEAIRDDLIGRRPLPAGLASWRIMRVFSLRPPLLRAFARAFLLTMWGGVLRREAKEALGVSVAQANSCDY
jgi:hypothetical protein